MTFRVGMKVVCVNVAGAELYLDKDAVYEITSINWPYLRVNCRPDGISRGPASCGYSNTRFRPVVERKTDISIFTAMLTPAQKETV